MVFKTPFLVNFSILMLRLYIAFFLLLILSPAIAQTQFPASAAADGSRFLFHHEIVEFFQSTANQNSDRMKLVRYGTTNEGRPLVAAYISSPENIANLENIRQNHLKNIGLLKGSAASETVPIAWLSYNVHGNEASSANTSTKVLYELLNPNNSFTQELLKNMVIIIDPCSNPDGYDRYTNWYTRFQNAVPDVTPFAMEHDEPWPGGRFNHYLFDLNRDWAWQTQKETKARIELYNQWMPHLHADFHEMGSARSYYFPPAAKPFHKDVTAWQRQVNELIGEFCSKYFDKNFWTYFTRTDYDLFYPSYGDTWPTFNGAVGLTFEQAGGGRGGLGIARESEHDTLTLKARMAHHFTTSMATLEVVLSQKEKMISEFNKFFKESSASPAGPYKSYIVKADGNESRTKAFAEYLTRQQIQFGIAGKSSASRGTNLISQIDENLKIDSSDLVITAYQPKSSLLRVLFEPQPVLEDSITYDVTSWGLGYVFGVNAFGTKEKLSSVAYKTNAPINILPSGKPYAYVAGWSSVQDATFLASLQKKDILVRTSPASLVINNINFPAGNLIITRKGNTMADFDKSVIDIANQHQVKLTPIYSGKASQGADLGDDNITTLNAKKYAVLAGEGISPTALGAIWNFFEQEIRYPLTLVNTNKLNNIPFSKIDVLILPDGDYSKIITDKTLDLLQEWVQSGGKIIALENSTDIFLNKAGFGLTKKMSDKKREEPLKKYGDQQRSEASNSSPGSMFQITFDATHPLSFGCSQNYFTFVRDSYERDYLKDGWNVGYLLKNNYRAGFVGANLSPKLRDTLIMGVQPIGKGEIVYLMDDPLFRGMFFNGKILFSNAIFR